MATATPARPAPRAPLVRRAPAPARTRSRPPRAAAAPPPPEPEPEPEPAALAARLAAAEAALAEERDRARFLAPYRVAAPRRGVVGESSYARELRRAVLDAARDPACAPVLIFGEPGLEKDNLAALVHFGSARGKAPLLALDCSRLDDDAAELFGRGARRGLLARAPADATVVLVDAHLSPPGAWPEINAAVAAAAAAGACGLTPRLILVSERPLPELAAGARVIKVPPLRVRREDVADLAELFLRDLSKRRGGGRVALTPAARRRLEAGAWPRNVVELRAAVERAVFQAEPTGASAGAGAGAAPPPLEVSDDLVWFAPAERGPARGLARLDLLRALPALRRFLRSPFWPDQLNFQFTVYAFAAIVAVLFIGPQDREHNAALLAFWDLWWPLSFFAYPFLGRIWCSVCPFMIVGELAQKGAAAAGWPLRRWPRAALDAWGAWFLFALFFGILVWEEAWDLPQHAALSSWLLLLITAGATLGSVFYERRVWCRYLCPIGGMNGLFAKLSMTELRARQGVCSAQCDTYSCYKGSPATPPEGLATHGCPLHSHPAQLVDNRDCVLCMTCLKACPHSSIEVRLRPPAADIWGGGHRPLAAEAALQWILLGAVAAHHLPALLSDFGIEPAGVLEPRLAHCAAAAAVLAAPGLVAWGADAAWRAVAGALAPARATLAIAGAAGASPDAARALSVLAAASTSYAGAAAGVPVVAPQKPFLDLSYGFLPLTWAATLAHYLAPLLLEAGHALPIAARTFAPLTDALEPLLEPLVFEANPAVVAFLQGSTLLFGAGASLVLSRRVAGQPWRTIAPQCALIAAFTAEAWHLILGAPL